MAHLGSVTIGGLTIPTTQAEINAIMTKAVTVPAAVRQQLAVQTQSSGKDIASGFMSDWRVIAAIVAIGAVVLIALFKKK